MRRQLFISFVYCLLSQLCVGQQLNELNANKMGIILDLISRIKEPGQNGKSISKTYLACVIDTREREIEYIQSTVYNGLLYGDYKPDSVLVDNLQATVGNRATLFLEHDSTKNFRDHVIYFPSQDSLGLKKTNGTSWYLEISTPVEGWENLTLYKNLNKGVYDISPQIHKYSREYLSIPVLVFKLENGVVKKEAVMMVYKILYKSEKILFVKKISF